MNHKKAQATVIIIVAIVIVIGIIATFIIINQQKKAAAEEYFASSAIKPELNALQSGITNCADEVSKEALNTIGLQGGYYALPSTSYNSGDVNLPYYYKEGSYLAPNKEEIENELSEYVKDNIDSCLSNLNSDFDLTYQVARTTSLIKDGEVQFKIVLPIKITKEGYSIIFDLNDHTIKINSKLNSIIEISDYITNSHKEDPEFYCISCLSEMLEERELYADIINFRENEMLVVISDNKTSSEPYSFEFLNKYAGNEKAIFNLEEPEAPSSNEA